MKGHITSMFGRKSTSSKFLAEFGQLVDDVNKSPAKKQKTISVGKRGIGFTRKNHEQTKKAIKLAKRQRAINRKMSNKKSRSTGSKQRK